MTAIAENDLSRLVPARRVPMAAVELAAASLSPEWVTPVVACGDEGALRVGAGAALAAGGMALAGVLVALLAG